VSAVVHKALFCCFTVILLLSAVMEARSDSDPKENGTLVRIERIIIVGNEKTDRKVILREMKVKTGDRYIPLHVERDRKRLQSLDLFNRVDIQPISTGEGVALLVIVSERWYWMPYPIFFYNERDVKKLSYGAGLAHLNVRGRAEKLQLSGWLGYNPGLFLYYHNPWFGGHHKFYFSGRTYYSSVESRVNTVDTFDEQHAGIELTVGKRWGFHTFGQLEMGFKRISFPERFKRISWTGTGSDRQSFAGFSIRYDSRDFIFYPRQGLYLKLSAKTLYWPEEFYSLRVGQDARVYLPLPGQSTLAMRSAYSRVLKDSPVYGRYYLGYNERIRGHFEYREAGNHRWLSSLELRIPIVPIQYISLVSATSGLGRYLTHLPFGLNMGFYIDAGAVWMEGSYPDALKSGYGVGWHLRVPYIHVIRIEYGRSMEGRSQWIFDLGVMF
jgi:outer membrane protein assembly factor BamA